MSAHRHTPEGYKVLAVLAGTPDIVVENIGSVLVCLDMETHPEGDFVVFVNGGSIPGGGQDSARFLNPVEAFECASAIARDVYANWVHEEWLEQDDSLGPDPMGDHGGNE